MIDPDFTCMHCTSSAPVALFVYNRQDHTRRTLQSLVACNGAQDTDLTIFSDASKNSDAERDVGAVRNLISNIQGFRSVEIVERPRNMGAAASIIDGITQMLTRHERAIFIEDDLVCAPQTLDFLNECLERYTDQPEILAVSAYNYPNRLMRIPKGYEYDIYFSHGFSPWGWASWSRALAHIDWSVSDYEDFLANPSQVEAFRKIGEDLPDLLARQQSGELDDWVLPMAYSIFKNNFLTLRPICSLIDNIGHDGSGLHCKPTELFRNDFSDAKTLYNYPPTISIDERLVRASRLTHSRSIYHRAARRTYDLIWQARRKLTR